MTSWTTRTLFAVGVLVTSTTSPPTYADSIDFDDVVATSSIEPCFGPNPSCTLPNLESRGFRVSSADNGFSDHAHLISAPWSLANQSYPSNGTSSAGLDPTTMSITRLDGAPFNLLGFDAAEGFLVNGAPVAFAQKLLIEGITMGGGLVNHIVDFDGANDGAGPGVDYQSFSLPSTFVNLSSVTFRTLTSAEEPGTGVFSFDNIVTSVVPIPSAFWLFAPTCLTLIWAQRRRTT